MKKQTRLVDTSARMTLYRDFAGAKVTLERIGSDEIRVRKIPSGKRKYALKELVAQITAQNRHDEISTGKPVGGEAW